MNQLEVFLERAANSETFATDGATVGSSFAVFDVQMALEGGRRVESKLALGTAQRPVFNIVKHFYDFIEHFLRFRLQNQQV